MLIQWWAYWLRHQIKGTLRERVEYARAFRPPHCRRTFNLTVVLDFSDWTASNSSNYLRHNFQAPKCKLYVFISSLLPVCSWIFNFFRALSVVLLTTDNRSRKSWSTQYRQEILFWIFFVFVFAWLPPTPPASIGNYIIRRKLLNEGWSIFDTC